MNTNSTLLKKFLSTIVIFTILGWSSLSAIAVGPTGPTGPTGPQGTIGVDKNALGPQSPTGPVNPTGPQGGVGVTGPTGPQSPTGPQGPVGPNNPITAATSSSGQNQASHQLGGANNSKNGGPGQASNVGGSSDSATSSLDAPTQSSPVSAASVIAPVTATPTSPNASASNSHTGANSDNQSGIVQSRTTEISENNRSNLNNQVIGSSSTGNNIANANTGDGDIVTGTITGAVNVLNVANSQIVAGSGSITQQNIGDSAQDIILGDPSTSTTTPLSAIVLGDLAGHSTATNDSTGSQSNNQATIRQVGDTQVRISRDGAVNNEVDLTANSGNNQANQNTGLGNIVTGTINFATNIVNFLNTFLMTDYLGLAFLNVFGTFSGNVVIPGAMASSDSTGSGSNNSSSINSNGSLHLTKESDASVNNNVLVDGQTGSNQTSRNTLAGSVTSGDTNVNVQSATITGEIPSDSLLLVIVNEIDDGLWTGDIIGADPDQVLVVVKRSEPTQLGASNTNTGANSINNASINQDNSTSIVQRDTALVNNNIRVRATTGNNQANDNTGGGSIKSGDVNVLGGLVNFVNAAGTSMKKVVISVINVFGKWTGNLIFGSKKQTVIPTAASTASLASSPTISEPVSAVVLPPSSSTSLSDLSQTKTSLPPTQPTIQKIAENSGPTAMVSQASETPVGSTNDSPSEIRQSVSRTSARPEKKFAQAQDLAIESPISSLPSPEISNLVDEPSTSKSSRIPNWYYIIVVGLAATTGLLLAYSRRQSQN